MPANQCEHWWGWGKHRFVTPLTLIVLQTYPYESAWTLKGALGLKTKDQSKHPTSITVIVLTDSCLPINVDTGVGGSEEHQPIKTPHVCNFVWQTHAYQAMWTLVGAGLKNMKQSKRPMSAVLPADCDWIADSAMAFNPEYNSLITASGKLVS